MKVVARMKYESTFEAELSHNACESLVIGKQSYRGPMPAQCTRLPHKKGLNCCRLSWKGKQLEPFHPRGGLVRSGSGAT